MYVHKVKKDRKKKHTTLITNHGHVTRISEFEKINFRL
jgi:hypothetical protein